MTLELRVVSGAREGTRERFTKSVVTVGRHPLSDLRFDPQGDLDVSTRHAELRGIDDVWTIRDQQSTNGTFVNGERLEGARALHSGDLITFGTNGPRVEVRVLRAEDEVAAPAALQRPSDASNALAAAASLAAAVPPAPLRRDTTVRIAEAVDAHTKSLKRAFIGGGAALVAAAVVAGVVWQRQSSAREAELLSVIARSESSSAALERAITQIRPRDSAFAALLDARATESRKALAELRSGSQAGAAGGAALFSERLAASTRLQQSVTRMDFATVHDRNDAAVAMIASDLDGVFIAGTAFGITTSGLMVTNRHVVRAESGQPARRVRVIFSDTKDWLAARVVRMDEGSDLALIQLENPGSYSIVAGVSRTGSRARVGAPVASIGYPHAVDTPMEGSGLHITARSTIAAGTVSKRLDDVIQIDSYAGKGSSGSPLFDAQSNVVGVVFGGAPESNGRIVYAVPAARLAAFIQRDAPGILRP